MQAVSVADDLWFGLLARIERRVIVLRNTEHLLLDQDTSTTTNEERRAKRGRTTARRNEYERTKDEKFSFSLFLFFFCCLREETMSRFTGPLGQKLGQSASGAKRLVFPEVEIANQVPKQDPKLLDLLANLDQATLNQKPSFVCPSFCFSSLSIKNKEQDVEMLFFVLLCFVLLSRH